MFLRIISMVLIFVIVGCNEGTLQSSSDLAGPIEGEASEDCESNRYKLLVRLSLAPVTLGGEDGCKVASGLWMDPYSGKFIQQASDLDVESVVPESWALRHGGRGWSSKQRRIFAEDPANTWLIGKGHGLSRNGRGPDKWLPPYQPARTIYMQQFRAIARKYRLAQ
ncbi:HNH endonuclease [Microbulbifer variabilis]|uniref:HNH endonuclease n=1 Tax=Microbulbifer variabilis TaxID=266805 RepID=A0ABY4VHT4_9GAMM|nr:HNH endonuclease [Microbulbifer variabilis]USD22956.1 HNH endonuclease [Microbulbifer variabilis]